MIASNNCHSNQERTMKILIRTGLLIVFAAFLPLHSNADIVITTDAGVVAAFQAGATIENFDDLAALTITSYASGQTVPIADQFSSRSPSIFTSPFYNSGGASFNDPVGNPGTPIGIFAPSGTIAGDVVSGTHVAGPLATGSDEAFNNGFMEVIFPADMQLVGFWITHASGPITMFLKDSTNTNLTTGDFQVTGSGSQFIGIRRDSADIRGITIGFTESFTIDDFTFSAVPEPAVTGLLALGLLGLVALRRR
jgi:PEP-CTERM motif